MTDHKPLVGIACMVVATAILAAKDGLAKSFLGEVSPFVTILYQYTFMFLILGLGSAPWYGWRVIMPAPLGWQLVRGAFSAAALVALYVALTQVPLADAIAMFMFAPTVATLLSPLLLREKIGILRLAAVAVGFIGVMIILRPGFSGQATGYLAGLMAGILMGVHYIANRKLAGAAPPLLNIVHNALAGALVLLPLVPFHWHTPPAALAGDLVVFLLLAITGQGLLITSFRFAPAPVIAPYAYAMLLFAILIGYLMFGTIPDATSWAGIILIIGAGVFIAWRERRQVALRTPQ